MGIGGSKNKEKLYMFGKLKYYKNYCINFWRFADADAFSLNLYSVPSKSEKFDFNLSQSNKFPNRISRFFNYSP